MFDVEIILLARAAGYRIAEFPLEWTCDPDSRTRILGQVLAFLRELQTAKGLAKKAAQS
jgi:hypothetical protein